MRHSAHANTAHDAWMKKPALLWGFILTGVFMFCYAGVFSNLVAAWWNNSVYSHGFLVPFISLYLIWIRRDELMRAPRRPARFRGPVLLAAGLVLLVAGHAASVSFMQEISIIVTIAGLVLTVLGPECLLIVLFPIVYLSFMIRFWEVFTSMLHFPFQNFSAYLGTTLLQFVGIPAYRQSIYIELPNITLKVAEVCSGVNYLIAVVAVGVPLAYITLRSWPRRVLLVSGGVLIAVLANGLRVALIGTLAYYHLAGDLHGPYHILQAMFVSIIGFIGLFAGAGLLAEKDRGKAASPAGRIPSRQLQGAGTGGYQAILAAGAILIVGAYVNLYHPPRVGLEKDFKYFPSTLDGWSGTEARADYGVFKSMGAEAELSRTYRNGDGEEVKLYVGYFGTQSQGSEIINYESARLHAGALREAVRINDTTFLEVNRIEENSGEAGREALFWYDFNGRRTASRTMAKVYTMTDYLFRGRNNGAVIIVSSGYGQGKDPSSAHMAETDFIKTVFPELSEYLPGYGT